MGKQVVERKRANRKKGKLTVILIERKTGNKINKRKGRLGMVAQALEEKGEENEFKKKKKRMH